MPTRKNIIDNTISTQRSRELVRLIIPILIRWAKSGKSDGTYKNLIIAIGMTKGFSGIGHQLGNVHRVFEALQDQCKFKIPTLNSLVKRSSDMLPSAGFDYVYPSYSELSDEEKRVFVEGLDSKAFKFKRWDWVLDQLGLKPSQITTKEELQSKTSKIGGAGGEGKDHKKLKLFIIEHPESIGLKDVVFKTDEYILPSSDRIDVYFERKNGDRIAVEVKPASSPDEDMMRGVFQCVKYKAIMEAVRTLECGSVNVSSILVLGGQLSNQNKEIASELGVDYIEEFKV